MQILNLEIDKLNLGLIERHADRICKKLALKKLTRW